MHSLDMEVEFLDDKYIIDAPWLSSPVAAPTFEEAYEAALRGRCQTSRMS